jgi:peptidoglycan hydrolase CwlO-like protein
MFDFSARLSNVLQKLVRTSERINITLPTADTESEAISPDEGGTGEVEALSLAPSIGNRLAAEGSGLHGLRVLSDPNGVMMKSADKGLGDSGPGKSAESASKASKSQGNSRAQSNAVSNAPLTGQEKSELLVILQRLDSTYTMEEVEALIAGIASGEITDISNRSLRRVVMAAREYGIDFVLAALEEQGVEMPIPPPQPAAPGGTQTNTVDEPGTYRGAPAAPATDNEGSETKAPSATPATSSTPSTSPTDTPTPAQTEEVSEEQTPLEQVQDVLTDVEDELQEIENLEQVTEEIGEVQEELGAVKEELSEVEAELAAVQAELETVQEVIQDIRQIIFVIRHRISDFRISRSHQSDTLPHLRMTKNSLLTNAFEKDTHDMARLEADQANQRRAQKRLAAEQQAMAEDIAKQQWSSLVASRQAEGTDRHVNPEADAPDLT